MRPTPSGSPFGREARGRHDIRRCHRLDAAIEAVQQGAIGQWRERMPASARGHPLRRQVARQVGLVPGLQQPHPRQRGAGRGRVGVAAVVALGEGGGEGFQRRRIRCPTARIGVLPASRRLSEAGRVVDDQQRLEARGGGAPYGGVDGRPGVTGAGRVAGIEARRRRRRGDVAPVNRDARDARAGATGEREGARPHGRFGGLEERAVGDAPQQAAPREGALEHRAALGERERRRGPGRPGAVVRQRSVGRRRAFGTAARGHRQHRRWQDPDGRRDRQPQAARQQRADASAAA